jgi:hypothetical protein
LYIEFLKNAYIIAEDRNDINFIDIPTELINYLIENSNKFISGKNIKGLFKESKHWQNFKHIDFPDLYFGLFDFSKTKEIDRFHFTIFSIVTEAELNEARTAFEDFARRTFWF